MTRDEAILLLLCALGSFLAVLQPGCTDRYLMRRDCIEDGGTITNLLTMECDR